MYTYIIYTINYITVASMLLMFSYMNLYVNIFRKENKFWVLTVFGLQM